MAASPQVYEMELKALCEIGQIVAQLLDLDHALEEALKALSKSLPMERAMIALLDPAAVKLSVKATCGVCPANRRKSICRLDAGLIDRLVENAQSFILPRSGEKPIFSSEIAPRGITKEEIAYFGAPIVIEQKTEGILIVDSLFPSDTPLEEGIGFLQERGIFLFWRIYSFKRPQWSMAAG